MVGHTDAEDAGQQIRQSSDMDLVPLTRRARAGTASSIQNATQTVRNATARVLDTDMPLGMWAATASVTSKAPTAEEIRRGSFGLNGWDEQIQRAHRRGSIAGSDDGDSLHRTSSRRKSSSAIPPTRQSTGLEVHNILTEEDLTTPPSGTVPVEIETDKAQNAPTIMTRQMTKPSLPDGYIAPPKKPWTETTAIALKASAKWICTIPGFLITIYALNVVAWGGMLFLLLCNAAPAMCAQNSASNHYDGCNDINSPRRIWLEIDSQILNGLFCVTGFGLIPWRFRDLYYLLRWRWTSQKKSGRVAKMYGLRVLAGIHSGWLRLPGSDTLDELSRDEYLSSIGEGGLRSLTTMEEEDERIPLPATRKPVDPISGVRAQPTRLWLLDFVIWCNCWNTFLQACLCGLMWGFNRHTRPSWGTGLFIGLACIVAGIGGIVMFRQGKAIKKVEGVAPPVLEENRIEKGLKRPPLETEGS